MARGLRLFGSPQAVQRADYILPFSPRIVKRKALVNSAKFPARFLCNLMKNPAGGGSLPYAAPAGGMPAPKHHEARLRAGKRMRRAARRRNPATPVSSVFLFQQIQRKAADGRKVKLPTLPARSPRRGTGDGRAPAAHSSKRSEGLGSLLDLLET